MSAYLRASLALLLLLITACAARGGAATPTPAVKIAERGDSFTVLIPALPNSLDPWASSPELVAPFAFNIYDTLTRRSRDHSVRPNLASEWRTIDERTWELTLRSGTKTHGGEPLTGPMVAQSLERSRTVSLSSEDVQSWPVLEGVDAISAPSSQVVRIHTRSPLPELPGRLSFVPIAGTDHDPMRAGTGPLHVVAWTPGQRLELEAWPDHWTGGQGRKLTFIAEADAAERFHRLQRGEADIASQLDPADWPTAKGGPTTEESTVSGSRLFYLGIVPRDSSSPLARSEVRRAIGDAIDLNDIGTRLFAGQIIRATDLMPEIGRGPASPPVDLAAARARLTQLGVSGSPVELLAPNGRFARDAALAEELARGLSAVGLQVQRVTVPWAQITTGVQPSATDRLYLGAWENALYDPTIGFGALVSGFPTLEASTRESFMEATARAELLADSEQRSQAFERARRLVGGACPAIPLFQPIDLYGTRRGLKWQARDDRRILLADIAR